MLCFVPVLCGCVWYVFCYVRKKALVIDLFALCVACLSVFVNCFTKQLAICLDVVVILLLNVMEVFIVGGGALLDRPRMVFQRMCVLCM